jgi:phosphate uptake regulator
MTDTKLIEDLTRIIIRQALIIRDLRGVTAQLQAVTSLDGDIDAIRAEVDRFTKGGTEQCGQ